MVSLQRLTNGWLIEIGKWRLTQRLTNGWLPEINKSWLTEVDPAMLTEVDHWLAYIVIGQWMAYIGWPMTGFQRITRAGLQR